MPIKEISAERANKSIRHGHISTSTCGHANPCLYVVRSHIASNFDRWTPAVKSFVMPYKICWQTIYSITLSWYFIYCHLTRNAGYTSQPSIDVYSVGSHTVSTEYVHAANQHHPKTKYQEGCLIKWKARTDPLCFAWPVADIGGLYAKRVGGIAKELTQEFDLAFNAIKRSWK